MVVSEASELRLDPLPGHGQRVLREVNEADVHAWVSGMADLSCSSLVCGVRRRSSADSRTGVVLECFLTYVLPPVNGSLQQNQ